MASSETEPPPSQPSAKARRRCGAFIGAFVLFQFVIPLTYLARDDATDERFTWRSFTAPTPPSCESLASLERLDGEHETVSLDKQIHQDWIDYLGQGRRAVIDALLKRECEAAGVVQVELVNHCGDDGVTRQYVLRCGGERSRETVRTAAR